MWTETGGGLKDNTCVSGWMMVVPFTDVRNTGERAGWWGGVEIRNLAFDVLPRGTRGRVERTELELRRKKDWRSSFTRPVL